MPIREPSTYTYAFGSSELLRMPSLRKNAKLRQFEIIELYDNVVLAFQIEPGGALMVINALLVFSHNNQTLSYNTRTSNSPSFILFLMKSICPTVQWVPGM